MKISLAGKIALVTGSTGGIGLAIAKGLAAAGAETIVNGRSKDKVDRVIAELKRALPEASCGASRRMSPMPPAATR
jgi:NAD(P)-dependent dehydrogenase (short-subunit alcohol dehydrogenase family)